MKYCLLRWHQDRVVGYIGSGDDITAILTHYLVLYKTYYMLFLAFINACMCGRTVSLVEVCVLVCTSILEIGGCKLISLMVSPKVCLIVYRYTLSISIYIQV